MKKVLALILIALMVFALAACGGSNSGNNTAPVSNPEEAKTMGEVFSFGNNESAFSFSEKSFCYLFNYEGTWYRAIALMDEATSKTVNDIDIFDEDWGDKVKDGLKDTEVTKIENLSLGVPSQEELDGYIGKTGQDLLDDEWIVSGWSIVGETMFFMEKGDYSYNVTFEEELEEIEDHEYDEDLPGLTVKKIEYTGMSNAASDIPDEYEG